MSTSTNQIEFSTGELAGMLNAELIGPADIALSTLAGIDEGNANALTFIRSDAYATRWKHSSCGAALISRSILEQVPRDETRALIVVDSADLAMVTILNRLKPPGSGPSEGIHDTAIIDESAKIGAGARIGARVIIGEDCVIGERVTIGPGTVLGASVQLGDDTELRANVIIEDRCIIGARCLIQGGCVVGSDGFGFVPNEDGSGVTKVPHIGHVLIEDDVELGSVVTIDRGKFGATTIGRFTKIDNQVQIAHNCVIGSGCLICSGCGIGGSTTIGNRVTIGGHVGVSNGITIGDGAQIGAKSGIMRDVPAGESWFGYPANPSKDAMKQIAALRKLPKVIKMLKQIDD